MSDNSRIEWTESRSESSRLIPPNVVAADESPRSAVTVEQRERGTAPTLATHNGVRFSRSTQIVARPMLTCVLPPRQHLQILWPVVLLVAVDVMHDLATPQGATDALRCDESVLVHIATAVGHRMASTPHQYVSVGRDCAPAFPLGICRTDFADSIAHQSIIAIRRDQRAYQN